MYKTKLLFFICKHICLEEYNNNELVGWMHKALQDMINKLQKYSNLILLLIIKINVYMLEDNKYMNIILNYK